MSARDSILAAVRTGRRNELAPRYALPPWSGDTTSRFVENAQSAAAEVREIAQMDDAPETIWAILVEKNAARRVHFSQKSKVNELPWSRAPGLTLASDPPSGSDTAVAFADFAIAETGTLVFCSGERSASSWHFLPGLEIVLVRRQLIVPRLESVIEALARKEPVPATINLVTGPSRTADIEQTIERGAHGPREVCILIAD